MKPFLQSLFHGLVGLLTWVVLTCIVCDPYAVDFSWTRILFLLFASALCWIASYQNSIKWERWIYLGILLGAFLITLYGWANGVLTSVFYAICFTCVAVSAFRSESRYSNLWTNQSRLTTTIIIILFWTWLAFLGLCFGGVIIPDYLKSI